MVIDSNMKIKIWIAAILAIVLVSSVVLISSIDEKVRLENREKVITEAKKIQEEKENTNRALDALLRSFMISEACWAPSDKGMYLVKVPDHVESEKYQNKGWYLIDTYNFIELSNGTWFLKSYSEWVSVYPDTSGLECKTQPVDPTWFKE